MYTIAWEIIGRINVGMIPYTVEPWIYLNHGHSMSGPYIARYHYNSIPLNCRHSAVLYNRQGIRLTHSHLQCDALPIAECLLHMHITARPGVFHRRSCNGHQELALVYPSSPPPYSQGFGSSIDRASHRRCECVCVISTQILRFISQKNLGTCTQVLLLTTASNMNMRIC